MVVPSVNCYFQKDFQNNSLVIVFILIAFLIQLFKNNIIKTIIPLLKDRPGVYKKIIFDILIKGPTIFEILIKGPTKTIDHIFK